MDSEDEYANDDDALGALDHALDEYAGTGPDNYSNAPAGQSYYDVDTSNPTFAQGDIANWSRYVDNAEGGGFDQRAEPAEDDFPANMAYDFPGGGGGLNNGSNPMNESTGSQGFGQASTSSLPEEIDVNTQGLIEETVQRLSFIRGVMGVLIVDRDGLIVHATMPPQEAAQLTGPALQLLQRARSACDEDDELEMLCVRTRKYEMLLCSEMKGAFAVCVVQDPTPEVEVEKDAVGAARSMKIGTAPAGVVF